MSGALSATEYRLLVEHAPIMIWRSGRDAKCDYFNAIWLAFTGRTAAQEMGDGWAEGVHADDLQRCVAHYLEHFERRTAFEMEYRLRRHDGEYRWIFDRGVPYVDETGAFAGFVGSCVDVDERRKAQLAQQHQSETQLARARDFERWILAIVSHDIRNPLGTIQNAAQALQKLSAAGSVVRQSAEMVGRAARRIQDIVGDLLDLSRVRHGAGISIEPRPADLRALCRQIIDELDAIGKGRRIEFDCNVDVSGVWDEHRVSQAVSNLASNALQHGEPGSPVGIRLTGDAERVAVEVRNAGSIPDELLPRLFEPFHSARQYARRGEGLGLGLFIAKAIADAHGGALEVSSADGATMFRLSLPRQTANTVR